MDFEEEIFDNESVEVTNKATIASLIRRTNAMRILLYLFKDTDNKESYYLQEIADSLDLNEATTFNNLNILIQAGLLCKSESKCNRKNRYFSIVDSELAEKVIAKYNYRVAFIIARLVPYQRLYATKLKGDKRFIDVCAEYGLTVSEGFNTLLSCHKISKQDVGKDLIIWRSTQGYDSPKELAEEIS